MGRRKDKCQDVSWYRNNHRQNQARKTELILSTIVKRVEKILGIEHCEVDGEVRKNLMLLINQLYTMAKQASEQVEALSATLESALGELEALRSHIADLEKENAEIRGLLETLTKQLEQSTSTSEALQGVIDELRKKLSRSSAKRNAAKSTEERMREVEKKLEACRKREERYRKLAEELEAALELEPNSEQQADQPAGDTVVKEAILEEEDVTEVITHEPEAEAVVQVEEFTDENVVVRQNQPGRHSPEEECIEGEEGSTQLNGDSLSAEKPLNAEQGTGMGVVSEEAARIIEELQAQLDAAKQSLAEKDELIEVLTFQANKDLKTSSVPPRYRGFREAMPRDKGENAGESPQTQTDTGEKPQAQEETDAQRAAREEEEACKAARKDPHKSPHRKSSTGRRGKPVGSKGGGRKIPENLDGGFTQVFCDPKECVGCPHHEQCMENAKIGPLRRRIDIDIRRVAEEFFTRSCQCPLRDGEVLSGSYPEGVNSTFNFGGTIRSLCVVMSTLGMVSYRRTAEIVGGLADISINQVTIENWVKQAGKRAKPISDLIKAAVMAGPYGNFDETGLKINGVLHWVHTSCNMDFTYLRVHARRGEDAVEDIGILPFYQGTAITDCWATYWKYGSKHGLCNAHLLRELFALVKFFKKDKEWAQEMMDHMNQMEKARKELKAAGKTCFDKETLQEYETKYDAIVEKGLKVNPLPKKEEGKRGRVKKTKARNLLERLKERKENFLLFIHDFQVDFTNNTAEKSFRMLATKRAVIGGFNTFQGAEDFCLIWSYVSSARKQGANAFDAVAELLEGRGAELLFSPEEIAEYTKAAEEQAIKEAERAKQRQKEEEEKEARKRKKSKSPKPAKAAKNNTAESAHGGVA